MDPSWSLEHIIAPALAALVGAVAGYVIAAARFGARLARVEDAVRHEDWEDGKPFRNVHTHLEQHLREDETFHAELRKDIDKKERMASQLDLQEAAEEAQKIQTERERWEKMERTLGRIEGILGMPHRGGYTPAPFSAVKKPDPTKR
jgi:cell division septum initiation protein DivIVA